MREGLLLPACRVIALVFMAISPFLPFSFLTLGAQVLRCEAQGYFCISTGGSKWPDPEWRWSRVVNSSLTRCLKLEGFFCLCVPHLTYIERTLVTVDLRSIIKWYVHVSRGNNLRNNAEYSSDFLDVNFFPWVFAFGLSVLITIQGTFRKLRWKKSRLA